MQTKLCRVKPKLRAIENDQNRRECNCSCPCPKESHVPEIRITILFVGSMLTGISRDRGFEPTVVHFFSLEVEVTPFNLP